MPRKGSILPVYGKDLKPVNTESDAIDSVQYDVDNEQCTIVFHKRGTYVYYDFPPEEFANLNLASSRGTYFNLYVRPIYNNYERIS